jgi:hypothetical protein
LVITELVPGLSKALSTNVPNKGHLKLVKQGVDAWNRWRRKHADTRPDLSGAHLREADLSGASLVRTNLENANLNGCRIYGTSAWDIGGVPREQLDLIITLYEPIVTVDNLEVAQFIYLLLNNQKIRQVIDTITSKVVVILGRFTEERKPVLDAIREELRRNNLTPILFERSQPAKTSREQLKLSHGWRGSLLRI